MPDQSYILIDPTYLAAAWEEAIGYPLTALDGRLANEVNGDLGRVHRAIWSQPSHYQPLTGNHQAALDQLRAWSELAIDHRDAVIRIRTAA
jgi:hypothetical protein